MFVAAAGGRDHAPAHTFCKILYSPVDVKTCACSLAPWFDTDLLSCVYLQNRVHLNFFFSFFNSSISFMFVFT